MTRPTFIIHLGLLLVLLSLNEARGEFCKEDNIEYPGHFKVDGGVLSAEQCAELCNSYSGCYIWSHHPKTARCFYRKYEVIVNRKFNRDFVSGFKNCKIEPPAVTDCYETDINYNGNDIRSEGNVPSPEICQTLCSEYVGCYYWTYRKSGRRCWLKNKAAPNGKRFNLGDVTGPAKCQGSPPPDTTTTTASLTTASKSTSTTFIDLCRTKARVDKYEVGIEWNAKTVDDCGMACEARDDCFYYTFRESDHVCFLKSKLARLALQPVASGFITGSKFCDWSSDCFQVGVNLAGGDLERVSSSSASECQGSCYARKDCAYFTFYKGQCYLKSEEARNNIRLEDSDVTSGPRTCRV